MTYHNAYTLISAAGQTTLGMTMYEACKALEAIANAGKLQDVTHVSQSGRPVAFFCQFRNCVRPMHKARDDERTILSAWA